jgi:hypothetical protein
MGTLQGGPKVDRKKLDVAAAIANYFGSFYISADGLEGEGLVAFVFGRADPAVAKTAAAVFNSGLVNYVVVSGSIGKDSGPLPALGLSEAGYLMALMMQAGVPSVNLYGEFSARNGGENCRLGITLMQQEGLISDIRYPIYKDDLDHLVLVGHWASLFRLYWQMETIGKRNGVNAMYQLIPTPQPAELSDVLVDELIAEFRRLMDWPLKEDEDGSTWLDPIELPPDLVAAVKALP